MSGPWPILILFVLVAVVAVAIGAVYERRRRDELAAFARRVGFEFAPGAAYAGTDLLRGYTPFGHGSAPRSSNLITGERGGVRWEMFDYRYTTRGRKKNHTHHYGVVVARVPTGLPRVTLRPEGVFDKIAALVGFDDIDFQSEEFSRRYHVKGDDRRQVHELIHPRMMDYFLSLPPAHWQLGPGLVLLVRGGKYGAAELERAMGMIEGFLALVPENVRKELAPRQGLPYHPGP